jgi:hypothetical protein
MYLEKDTSEPLFAREDSKSDSSDGNPFRDEQSTPTEDDAAGYGTNNHLQRDIYNSKGRKVLSVKQINYAIGLIDKQHQLKQTTTMR